MFKYNIKIIFDYNYKINYKSSIIIHTKFNINSKI